MSKDKFDTLAEQLLGDRDVDDDGVVNYEDCRPLDPERQDLKGALSSLGSKLKSGAKKIKSKYSSLKRGAEVAESAKRREELKKLKEQREKLQKQREMAEKKRKLQEEKQKLEEAKPPGTLEKIMGFLQKAKSRETSGEGGDNLGNIEGFVIGTSGKGEFDAFGGGSGEDEKRPWYDQGLV